MPAVEAHDPVALGVDVQQGHQRIELFTLDDEVLAAVAQFEHIAFLVGRDPDNDRRFVHQPMERLDAGIHLADPGLQRGHPVAQFPDLVADTVGLLTRLQHQGRSGRNP